MSIFFIEQNDKQSIFNFNRIVERENKIIINRDINKQKLKQKIKIVNLIKKILLDKRCKKVVLDLNLKNDKEFKNLLYSSNIDIIDGKWLLRIILPELLDELIKKYNLKKNCIELSFTTNENSQLLEKYIKEFSREFKRVNIITNHIGEFKKIEEELYIKEGILITVTNNKRKSLSRSNIIVNMNYPKEILSKFNINDKAIIINIDDKINKLKKRFDGILINDYNIDIKKNEKLDNWINEKYIKVEKFNKKDIYEVYCYIKGIEKNDFTVII